MGLCQWGRAVPGLSPHRAENTVLVAELTTSAPQRCSPCPGDSQGLSPRAGPQGALLEGCGLWALQKFVPTLCKLRLGSSHAVTSPCSVSGCWAPVAHLLLPASPCLVPLQKWGSPCLVPLQKWGPLWLQPAPPCPVQLSGITTVPQLLGTARAAPGQAASPTSPPSTHVWPPARPGWGQGEISGCRKAGGDPMTLSHDLPPHPSPLRAALMGLSLPRS